MVKTAKLNTDLASSPAIADDLNTDLSTHIAISTHNLPWQTSPAPGVLRKRLYRAGPQEAGRVTSIVRYDAGAVFPRHDHPQGEEIFVLEGVFSDERGDWPAGTYLLNPEGYRHGPWSKQGCTLFVRLRQHPGLDRSSVSVLAADRRWRDEPERTVAYRICILSESTPTEGMTSEDRPDRSLLFNCANPIDLGEQRLLQDLELYVITGGIEIDDKYWPAGSWLRWPAGYSVRVTGGDSSVLYARTGGFKYLG
tara:strand:- start:379 stop:1134 length:756 start_codon:yes stop_codon:yes gene_type:complete